MCIIAGPVESVSTTKIFVAPSKGGDRQLVVYSNSVSTKSSNMMILPVPHPETLRFEKDVMDYKDLYRDCADSLFIYKPDQQRNEWSLRSAPLSSYLPVLDVGSYQVSVAMSFEDLYKLNPVVFARDPPIPRSLVS